MNDTVKINMAKVFEVAWRELLGQAAEPSLAELMKRFEVHLRRAVLCIARGIDFHLQNQKDNTPELVLNLLSHGPLEKGRDITDGGAMFYNMCCDGAGLATVADSLSAIEQRVVVEKKLSWRKLDYYLQNDFAGKQGERIRQLLRHSGRFGQGGSRGDHWALWLSKLYTEIVSGKRTPHGYLLIPGFFSWANTVEFGKTVGATPNGRHANAPISHGANPDPGFRQDGAVTAFATAIANIQPGRGNTAPMQLELDLGTLKGEEGVKKIMSLLRTHFKLGGTLINVNIVDAAKIRAAHQNPELYPDLVVRVTGFTAYFASLSPPFRQLVVNRLIENE